MADGRAPGRLLPPAPEPADGEEERRDAERPECRRVEQQTRAEACDSAENRPAQERDREQGDQDDDLFTLDQESLSLAGTAAVDVHDLFVFAGNRGMVKDVFVAGTRVIADGQHARGEEFARRYQRTMRALLADS